LFDFSGRVVTQLTSDVGKVFSKLHLLPIEGKLDFCKGIKVANVNFFRIINNKYSSMLFYE
jgi:hypothetical protein